MSDITPQEIEKLKNNWLKDPCWDIEDSEGFEAYREELLAFRLEQEADWEAEREEQLEDMRGKAARKKCPMSMPHPCISDGCAWWLDDIENCAVVKLAKIPDAVNEVAQIIADSQPPASYYRQ